MVTLAGTASPPAPTAAAASPRFPALPAGGPYDLTIAAPSGAAVVRDLLVGDVFLCSGQSNMEMTVSSAQDMIADAHAPPTTDCACSP